MITDAVLNSVDKQIDKFFIATKTNTSIVYVTTIKKHMDCCSN